MSAPTAGALAGWLADEGAGSARARVPTLGGVRSAPARLVRLLQHTSRDACAPRRRMRGRRGLGPRTLDGSVACGRNTPHAAGAIAGGAL